MFLFHGWPEEVSKRLNHVIMLLLCVCLVLYFLNIFLLVYIHITQFLISSSSYFFFFFFFFLKSFLCSFHFVFGKKNLINQRNIRYPRSLSW
jgi:hypothetical protein